MLWVTREARILSLFVNLERTALCTYSTLSSAYKLSYSFNFFAIDICLFIFFFSSKGDCLKTLYLIMVFMECYKMLGFFLFILKKGFFFDLRHSPLVWNSLPCILTAEFEKRHFYSFFLLAINSTFLDEVFVLVVLFRCLHCRSRSYL